ncbi:putative basic proline-rich protein-like [Iris pallida]|uniref:Basic proline-rich protein-like n=1 Tax=Iris pallida TaxID=29817 RepID=A0AAX6GHY5_IRIPA|nr:putative basic proline-rich protein-like [Iris pallida]
MRLTAVRGQAAPLSALFPTPSTPPGALSGRTRAPDRAAPPPASAHSRRTPPRALPGGSPAVRTPDRADPRARATPSPRCQRLRVRPPLSADSPAADPLFPAEPLPAARRPASPRPLRGLWPDLSRGSLSPADSSAPLLCVGDPVVARRCCPDLRPAAELRFGFFPRFSRGSPPTEFGIRRFT